MQIIYWAAAIAIIIIALGIAISLITKARVTAVMAAVQSGEDEDEQAKLVAREEDLIKSLNGDLNVIRSARFGLTMTPVQRQVPARLRKE